MTKQRQLRLRPNGKKLRLRPNGKNSRLPQVPGILKGQIPDVLWLNCVTCQDLAPVQHRSVSGRLNAMMNDVGGGWLNEMMNDVDVGLDVSFICRHCK